VKFSAVYIERAIAEHELTQRIIARVSGTPVIVIDRYGEVFNRAGQNFRIQKRAPALILAKKHGKTVLPAPEGYGFEQGRGFYFSHMLNCLYDCRYCFLQGMYRSAHYVLFVNYEDFMAGIDAETLKHDEGTVFYSGYDCDSLAMEPISAFCERFIPFFCQQTCIDPGDSNQKHTSSTTAGFSADRQLRCRHELHSGSGIEAVGA